MYCHDNFLYFPVQKRPKFFPLKGKRKKHKMLNAEKTLGLIIGAPIGTIARIPAHRRIMSSDTTFIYDGGNLMDAMAILSGISNAVGFYKTAVDLVDEAKIASATNEINTQLAVAGAHILSMQKQEVLATEEIRALKTTVHEMEKKIASLEERITDRARYELARVSEGNFAYKLKESAANGEPAHYLCQACMDNGMTKSVLQKHGATLKCPALHPDLVLDVAPRSVDLVPYRFNPSGWMGS